MEDTCLAASSVPFVVYGLFTRTDAGVEEFFYVGQTEREVSLRVREHQYKTAHSHEDLYIYLRELEGAGRKWFWKVIRQCEGAEYRPDAERFEQIVLLRQKHNLRNMRLGDAERRAELVRQVASRVIRNAGDLALQRSVDAQRVVKRAHKKLQRALLEADLKKGISDVEGCLLLSPAVRRRLLYPHGGPGSIEKGFDLRALLKLARSYKALDFMRAISDKNPPEKMGTT